MKNLKIKPGLTIIHKTLLRTILRFNPFFRPIIPAHFTVYLLAVSFTVLYFRDRFLCTFITEYREIALSAWGFLLLMNFLEALMETWNYNETEENDHDS